MAIDFNQDIAPLRQQYFPALVGDRAFDQAMKYRQEVTLPMRANSMKRRQQELAYESQKLDLQKARKAAQNQNDALEFRPQIDSLINGILDDETLSPLEKSEELSRGQMTYAPQLIHSPVISSIFGAAFKAADSQRSIEAKGEQDKIKAKMLEQKKQLEYNEAIKIARGLGDTDLVTRLVEADGDVSLIDEASQRSAEDTKSSLNESYRNSQRAAQDVDRKERLANYKDFYEQVSDIESQVASTATLGGAEKGEEPPFVLGRANRQILESVFTFVDRVKYPASKVEDLLSSYSDAELRRAALNTLSSKMAMNAPSEAASALLTAYDDD